jgi:hypothetical protein
MARIYSKGSKSQHDARKTLLNLFEKCPIPTDQLLVNLHLYMRSSVVAKMLYLNELYQKVIELPGVVMEFGVWWGANLTFFECLRAVYEPYNYTRKIIGFDTFQGYSAPNKEDGTSSYVTKGSYSVSSGYEKYLQKLLDYHEAENSLSHIKKTELVKGDAGVMIQKYLKNNPETIISLAYLDLQLYEPTKNCLQAIRSHLVKGSIIALDELNNRDFPGETIALKETFGLAKCKIVKSQFLPDRSFLIYGD